MKTLRTLIGNTFPVALAGFPYIDYHPAFPYSVFLGPGGAQYNVPQMYWYDIGTSVDAVYAHTYDFNRIYGRPIFPLGPDLQLPPGARHPPLPTALALVRGGRRELVGLAGGHRRSVARDLAADRVAERLQRRTPRSRPLGLQDQGDVVVWAQEHLRQRRPDGRDRRRVRRRDPDRGAAVPDRSRLQATGEIDAATWQALLRYPPAAVRWTRKGAKTASRRARVRGDRAADAAHRRRYRRSATRSPAPVAPGSRRRYRARATCQSRPCSRA